MVRKRKWGKEVRIMSEEQKTVSRQIAEIADKLPAESKEIAIAYMCGNVTGVQMEKTRLTYFGNTAPTNPDCFIVQRFIVTFYFETFIVIAALTANCAKVIPICAELTHLSVSYTHLRAHET